MATKPKHISYQAQREQCRLNKFTYIEKVNSIPTLFCNYPFPEPEHKKGLCLARTCTDMREIPADIVEADSKVTTCDELDQNTLADSGEGNIMPEVEDKTAMPVCSND